MKENIEIKGRRIKQGTTLICVPVIEKRKEDILKRVRMLADKNVPMIEWRLDWFEQVMDKESVAQVLEEVSACIPNTILLCTFRSKAQGGEKSINKNEYVELIFLLAKSGKADLLDLEYYETDNPSQLIEQLHLCGVKVIASHHDFEKTPAVGIMKEKMLTMLKGQADVAKLAVMPENKSDVLDLMEAVLQVRKEMPNGHVAAMSMGADGMISRVLAEWFGSEITFGACGTESAPGQLPYDELQDILIKIQESVIKS